MLVPSDVAVERLAPSQTQAVALTWRDCLDKRKGLSVEGQGFRALRCTKSTGIGSLTRHGPTSRTVIDAPESYSPVIEVKPSVGGIRSDCYPNLRLGGEKKQRVDRSYHQACLVVSASLPETDAHSDSFNQPEGGSERVGAC